MTLIVAGSEPPSFRAIADVVSNSAEKMGVDAMWSSKSWGMVGVQRKEFKDLIASVADGRLAREVAQMQRLGLAVLMIEGRPSWTSDGELVHRYARWTKSQHRGLVRSVQSKGVWVESTDSLADTIDAVQDMRRWSERDRHSSLDRRPKPTGAWGKADQRDFASHLVQGVDGVGPVLANAILDRFKGIPWTWTCTFDELLEVPGMGPATAEKMWHALGAEVPVKEKRRRGKAAPAK